MRIYAFRTQKYSIFFKIVISVYRQNFIINRDDNGRKKIVIFLQYIEYYSIISVHIYL